ncbi:glycosyltransferase [Tundrisphaera lichenicola]|uniref:glycosyltransferase n=1 Tax=Tundrisphaera lichenicola TaxID=2029860 RepID=UPI003EB8129E
MPISTISWVASLSGVLGSLPWAWHLLHLVRNRDQVVFLAECSDECPEGGWPTLAVVFAARDEATAVEQATRSMLALDYPGLGVIAVDDRSADATGTILDDLAREDVRLRVVHVEDLPSGWLGKTHALQAASESTESRWILFTDADVIYEPSTLRRAVAFAEARRLDHLTAYPEVLGDSVGERLFLGLFGLLFALNAPIGRVADVGSRAHAGVGAFNLVRAESFRAIGGFRHLALSVDDDMRLAQALKFAGYRTRLVFGRDSVAVRWQVKLGGMVRGLEKNFFAALGFRLDKALVVAVGLVVIGVMPYLGVLVGPIWARVACGLGVASIAATLGAATRHSRISWVYATLVPVATLFVMLALIRSVVVTLRQGGVRWRGHLYPIRELKAHIRARDAWLREVWLSTR